MEKELFCPEADYRTLVSKLKRGELTDFTELSFKTNCYFCKTLINELPVPALEVILFGSNGRMFSAAVPFHQHCYEITIAD